MYHLSKSNQLENCNTDNKKQCISHCLRRVGSDWSESVERLTDDKSHERGNTPAITEAKIAGEKPKR